MNLIPSWAVLGLLGKLGLNSETLSNKQIAKTVNNKKLLVLIIYIILEIYPIFVLETLKILSHDCVKIFHAIF